MAATQKCIEDRRYTVRGDEVRVADLMADDSLESDHGGVVHDCTLDLAVEMFPDRQISFSFGS